MANLNFMNRGRGGGSTDEVLFRGKKNFWGSSFVSREISQLSLFTAGLSICDLDIDLDIDVGNDIGKMATTVEEEEQNSFNQLSYFFVALGCH